MNRKEAIELLEKKCYHLVFGWCYYKGEAYAVRWNVEKTMQKKKPMVDICYCLTAMQNDIVEKTVMFNSVNFMRI